MKSALEEIREQGYAVEDGENRIGLRGVAAPIFDFNDTPQYAIGLIGMFRRTLSEDFQMAKALVCSSAKMISKQMGYVSP
jgi:IclR family acetate operon transcriptional repressor